MSAPSTWALINAEVDAGLRCRDCDHTLDPGEGVSPPDSGDLVHAGRCPTGCPTDPDPATSPVVAAAHAYDAVLRRNRRPITSPAQ